MKAEPLQEGAMALRQPAQREEGRHVQLSPAQRIPNAIPGRAENNPAALSSAITVGVVGGIQLDRVIVLRGQASLLHGNAFQCRSEACPRRRQSRHRRFRTMAPAVAASTDSIVAADSTGYESAAAARG